MMQKAQCGGLIRNGNNGHNSTQVGPQIVNTVKYIFHFD